MIVESSGDSWSSQVNIVGLATHVREILMFTILELGVGND